MPRSLCLCVVIAAGCIGQVEGGRASHSSTQEGTDAFADSDGAGDSGGAGDSDGGADDDSGGDESHPGQPNPTTVLEPPNGGVPAAAGTTNLPLSAAAAIPGTINVAANRSSVVLFLPGVVGARDYRVFAVENGVSVSVDSGGHEHVAGATLHCAGLRQRNQCDEGEILPVRYNNERLDMPVCTNGQDRRPHVPAQLMQTLEVNGIGPNTTLVVEAIDRQCPFPGLFGTTHKDVEIASPGPDFPSNTVDVTVNEASYALQLFPETFPVRTEAEIRAQYGSMIFNGQGPNLPVLDPSSPYFPESPYIRVAQPAPADDPVVLARAVIEVSPTGNATPPAGFTEADYFDDFEEDSDQPQFVRDTDYIETFMGVPVALYRTSKWNLYDVTNEFSDFFIDRGQLNMVSGDPDQDSMSLQAMYPRRPVQLPTLEDTDSYLHVTYETQRIESDRRYENLVLCGSDVAGQTYDGDAPKSAPLPRPNFMNAGPTARTNPFGWNCLQLIPRGQGYWRLDGGDVNSHAETSLSVSVVRTHPPPANGAAYDDVHIPEYIINFGPTQDVFSPLLERQVDENGEISGMWLDDHMHAWQRVKFDVFIRRDRVVIYVNGEQRMCTDLSASPLTMAEGALGFWHVLYHTTAEFLEMRLDAGGTTNPRTGLHHILHNTPFADQRSYDNVGFRENVLLPADFNVARCL